MNVIPLRTTEQVYLEAARKDVLSILDSLRSRAEAGDIIGFAFAWLKPDGEVGTGWKGYDDPSLGFAVNLLSARFMAAAVEEIDG